ncbi:MAG: UDP-N-acetylmuramoyl-L-alanyl-D-glutamate--2,6-diaminopimelate ligase [Planctomycetes bacterium]|nr:UDP-N-acetylmuramoyl-L-alanyl-D-glutamate--2,6-diaminopimelate ligase [Planctomycetota bacterium]
MTAGARAATPQAGKTQAGKTLDTLARAMGVVAPVRLRGVLVESLCGDSRECGRGDLFFAVPGTKQDGAQFLAAAAAAGAVAAVVARESAAAAAAANLPAIVVGSVRLAKALAAHSFYDQPSHALACVGVTGTKGKTTAASFVHAILAAAGEAPSLLGTIDELIWGKSRRPSAHTTPDPIRLAALLADARAAGGRSVVMEVSSHALDQERVSGMRYRAAIFTQLAREHLDYHPTVEHYCDSKARLFTMLAADAVAAVNAEDVHALEMTKRSRARLLTYGDAPGAHVRARAITADACGSRIEVELARELGGGSFELEVALAGRHNAMNAVAAATAALGMGLERSAIARGVASLCRVSGRLEAVDAGQPFRVLIDYAHTDDSLEKILKLLRPLTRGRLITVFGCGGERDRSKRRRMGRVAALYSDRVVVTSDNPRGEDPDRIIAEIVVGIPAGTSYLIEPDRRAAIASALAGAGDGDVVLIAGKGHEDYQLVGGQKLRFDDREVARELLCHPSA